MKRPLAACVLATLATQGITDAQSDCVAAWADVAAPLGGTGGEQVLAAANGWCEVDLFKPGFVAAQIEGAAFRVDQLPNAFAGNRTLELDLEGVKTLIGTFDGTAALSIHNGTGIVQMQSLRFIGDDGRGLRATALVDLDGAFIFPEQHQSQGDPVAQFINLDVIVTPAALTDARIDFSDVTRAAVSSALQDVSNTQISGQARREFLRFVGAVPNARGTLSVAVQFSENAKVLGMIAPFLSLDRAPDDTQISHAFASAMDGVRVDVTWKPGRM